RLFPPAPAFTLMPKEDTVLDGRFALRARSPVMVLAGALHRDPKIWGDNPELFDPSHFSAEAEAARAPNAFKPFGNGQRACIGRQFALQESVLALAMILQRFRLLDHRNYQLNIKESLTFKAEGFRIRIRPRTARDRADTQNAQDASVQPQAAAKAPPVGAARHGTRLLVLYGSNMGTAEQAARRIMEEGQLYGYEASIGTLDEYAGRLPTEGLVLIATASYNGTPPDNAGAFCEWLTSTPGDLSGVRYAVFGLGNRDWATTYQRIPRLLDSALEEAGAERLLPPGEADAAGDFYGQVDNWFATLWPQLGTQLGLDSVAEVSRGPRLNVALVGSASLAEVVANNNRLQAMTVVANTELVQGDTAEYGSKRHLTLALPDGVRYKTGDHLLVMPQTPSALVDRALARFALAPDQTIVLSANYGDASALPLNQPLLVADLLRYWLSLTEPATRRQVEALAEAADCPPDRDRLQALLADAQIFDREVRLPRVTVLDLLEQSPSCEWGLAEFLDVLPELQPRYYSISSSHHVSPDQVDITISVVDEPALSGRGQHQGAATSLMAATAVGASLFARVRAVDSNFLPPQAASESYLMIGAGTGVAPFRGFVQDRVQRLAQGDSLAPAWLLFGCRHPDADYLYRDEFERAAQQGAVELMPAFSRLPGSAHRYVQDRLLAETEQLWPAITAGALIYVCGDATHMLEGVRAALAHMYRQSHGVDTAAAELWLTDMETRGQLRIDAWS
ncbi:MAG: cytochrome P450, partial [Pseudomonadales bacterium]